MNMFSIRTKFIFPGASFFHGQCHYRYIFMLFQVVPLYLGKVAVPSSLSIVCLLLACVLQYLLKIVLGEGAIELFNFICKPSGEFFFVENCILILIVIFSSLHLIFAII